MVNTEEDMVNEERTLPVAENTEAVAKPVEETDNVAQPQAEETTAETLTQPAEQAVDPVAADAEKTAAGESPDGVTAETETNADDEKLPDSEADEGLPVPESVFSAPDAEIKAALAVADERLKNMTERLDLVDTNGQKLFAEVREMHKLYHTEFAGRLRNMQSELEEYRKVEKGRIFDGILEELATIYGTYENLPEQIEEPKAKKAARYLLEELDELLAAYGVSKWKSTPGDKRSPRFCRVQKRIAAADPAQHDTVAKSYNTGFSIGNRIIVHEMIDVFLYDRSTGEQVQAEAEAEGAGAQTASENE